MIDSKIPAYAYRGLLREVQGSRLIKNHHSVFDIQVVEGIVRAFERRWGVTCSFGFVVACGVPGPTMWYLSSIEPKQVCTSHPGTSGLIRVSKTDIVPL